MLYSVKLVILQYVEQYIKLNKIRIIRRKERASSWGTLFDNLLSGHPSNLDDSRPTINCACSKCEWELCGYLFFSLSLSFFSLSMRDEPI